MSMHIKEWDAIVNKSNLQTSLQNALDIFVITFKVQHMDLNHLMEYYVHKYNENTPFYIHQIHSFPYRKSLNKLELSCADA